MQNAPGGTDRTEVTASLLDVGVVAVVRLPSARQVVDVAKALQAGGVPAVEVTLTIPEAFDAIASASEELGAGHLVGAGSVIRPDQVERAVAAGARYVVSPVLRREIIDAGHALGVPVYAAGFTPTEVLAAAEAGADLVKVFPSDVGGTKLIKGILGPMPGLKLMPTGGVTPENAGDWIRAGASAVGIGSALVDKGLVADGRFEEITARAARSVRSVAEGRA